MQEVDEKWEHLKESITQAAEETNPKSQRKAKKKWMNDEILKMMDGRRKSKQDRDAYDALNKQITTKCNEAKEKWLNEKCDDIEKNHKHDSKSMHARIREINGKRICSAPGCLKSREGNIIMEKENILEIWSEYISELCHDERGDKPPIMKNVDGPPIMKDEVRKNVKSMKKGKAGGPDKITVEMIESLDEFGIDMLTDCLNAIYDSGEIPSDLSKSIFIALPKKPGDTECESHRTISLMSHITKILLKILMARMRNKTTPEFAEEQCGFVKDKGTRNAIYMLRTLTERAI